MVILGALASFVLVVVAVKAGEAGAAECGAILAALGFDRTSLTIMLGRDEAAEVAPVAVAVEVEAVLLLALDDDPASEGAASALATVDEGVRDEVDRVRG